MNNKFLYYIFRLYNFLSTVLENYFYQKQKITTKSEIQSKGYMVFKCVSINTDYEKIKNINKYMTKYIFTKDQISKIIENIFIRNDFKNKITSLTGFKYFINFFIAYQTTSVCDEDKQKGWFANHWHRDKPFSKNTLKVIVPLKEITDKDGGIEICSIEDSIKFFKNEREIKNLNSFYKFSGKTEDLLLFNPNRCFHRAGYPEKSHVRKQIMLQLNPFDHWSYSKNLYNKQYYIEPKFPFLSNWKEKKLHL